MNDAEVRAIIDDDSIKVQAPEPNFPDMLSE
jgi:hypothetical protein